MRALLRTHDLSLALSARLALDAAAIPYRANYGADMDPSRSPMELFVLNDADYDAARDVLASLQASSIAATPAGGSKRFLWFCIVVCTLAVIAVVARAVIPR